MLTFEREKANHIAVSIKKNIFVRTPNYINIQNMQISMQYIQRLTCKYCKVREKERQSGLKVKQNTCVFNGADTSGPFLKRQTSSKPNLKTVRGVIP